MKLKVGKLKLLLIVTAVLGLLVTLTPAEATTYYTPNYGGATFLIKTGDVEECRYEYDVSTGSLYLWAKTGKDHWPYSECEVKGWLGVITGYNGPTGTQSVTITYKLYGELRTNGNGIARIEVYFSIVDLETGYKAFYERIYKRETTFGGIGVSVSLSYTVSVYLISGHGYKFELIVYVYAYSHYGFWADSNFYMREGTWPYSYYVRWLSLSVPYGGPTIE